MLATRVNGLHVCYGEMEFDIGAPTHIDDGGWGYRVKIDSVDAVVPMKFLRERDAVVAMHSISHLLDWTMDRESLQSAIQPLVNKIRRLMTESLQW